MLQECIIKAAHALPPDSHFITEKYIVKYNIIQYINQLQKKTYSTTHIIISLGTEKQPLYIFCIFFIVYWNVSLLYYIFNVNDFLIRFGFPGIVNASFECKKEILSHQKVYRKSKTMKSIFEMEKDFYLNKEHCSGFYIERN